MLHQKQRPEQDKDLKGTVAVDWVLKRVRTKDDADTPKPEDTQQQESHDPEA